MTRPTIRIAGTAVQMTSRRVLPWIGGPSSCSSPGRMRNSSTEKHTTTVTSTKIGTDAMMRTSQKVSILSAWVESAGGNQWMTRPIAMPTAVAITPTMTICWTVRLRSRRGVLSSAMPAASYGSSATERNDVREGAQTGTEATRGPLPRPAGGRRERNVDGDAPWWRRKALANWAGWR